MKLLFGFAGVVFLVAYWCAPARATGFDKSHYLFQPFLDHCELNPVTKTRRYRQIIRSLELPPRLRPELTSRLRRVFFFESMVRNEITTAKAFRGCLANYRACLLTGNCKTAAKGIATIEARTSLAKIDEERDETDPPIVLSYFGIDVNQVEGTQLAAVSYLVDMQVRLLRFRYVLFELAAVTPGYLVDPEKDLSHATEDDLLRATNRVREELPRLKIAMRPRPHTVALARQIWTDPALPSAFAGFLKDYLEFVDFLTARRAATPKLFYQYVESLEVFLNGIKNRTH